MTKTIYLIRPDFQDGHAYLYRFLASNDYRDPLITRIPRGAAGKFSMALDQKRRQIYYFAHNNTFHRIVSVVLQVTITVQPGETMQSAFPSRIRIRLAVAGRSLEMLGSLDHSQIRLVQRRNPVANRRFTSFAYAPNEGT